MRVCILGATGLVGRETLLLAERAWPGAELELFASRDQALEHGGRTLEVHAAAKLERDDAQRGDLAMVALDDEHSRRYVPRLLDLGYRVVDKSNTYRMDPGVPLVSAGVNADLVDDGVRLVANPNCTTIPFTLAVAPIAARWGLRAATVSSYQAISGAGTGALDAFLADARQGYEEPNRLGTQLDASRYAGNVVPHSGKTDETGFSSEERKLVHESRKILAAPELGVCAQCCRVPVAVGHYINAWITLERPATPVDIEAALREAPFVRVIAGPAGDSLSALECVRDRDRALVGRARRDSRDPNGRALCMTIAADNLRLGAATNAIRIASRWYPSQDPDLQA